MEKKMKTKHHNKNGPQLHKPLDAYEVYELEHMPHNLVELPSDGPEPHAHEASRTDCFDTGREMQPYWHPRGDENGEIFRPDDYETERTMQPHWRPPKDDAGGISKENIDAEAEEFIMLEHDKFNLSKWMSKNTN